MEPLSVRYPLILLCLLFVFSVRVSCTFTKQVDVRNPTGRSMKLGGNTIHTIHASNRNNHIVGITNGKSIGIGGVLGAKESKVIGDSIRKGLRKVLPFGNSIKQNNRVSSTGTTSARTKAFNTRQMKSAPQAKTLRTSSSTGRIGNVQTAVGNTINTNTKLQRSLTGRPTGVTRGRSNKVIIGNVVGSSSRKSGSENNIQRSIAGRPTSVNRGRSNKAVAGNGVGSGSTSPGSEKRVQQLSRSSNTNAQTQIASKNGVIQSQNTVRGAATGKTRQVRRPPSSTRGVAVKSRTVPSITSNGRGGNSRSTNSRGMASPGSSNGRGVAISTNTNQNGINRNNDGNSRNGLVRNRISEGNMIGNTGKLNRNNGQNVHSSARVDKSGRQASGQNRMQHGGRHSSYRVSSGMQSNIRRRTGGIPRGISNSGKRVVVQNGRRIIVSPSRYNMHQRRRRPYPQQQRRRQVRIEGDLMEGGLENMDIDNIIGLASKIASVKLANSVLSSIIGPEGAPQLSRFLINSELDIVPELIVSAPRQAMQAPRRTVTIMKNAPAVRQSSPQAAPQAATNVVKVSSSGYGTPVLLRSGGDIQYSRVDQTGKEISSVTISKRKQTQTVNSGVTGSTNANTGANGETGNNSGASTGGTSKQAPVEEAEMEMEQEGLMSTTTTLAPTTTTNKPLLPPTTTVANSVIVI